MTGALLTAAWFMVPFLAPEWTMRPEAAHPDVVAELDRTRGSHKVALELLEARDRDVVALLDERITRPRYPEQGRWAIDELGKYPAAVAARGLAGAPGARDGQLRLEEATALANHKAMDVLNRALASGVNEAAFGLDSLVVQANVNAFRSALAAPEVAMAERRRRELQVGPHEAARLPVGSGRRDGVLLDALALVHLRRVAEQRDRETAGDRVDVVFADSRRTRSSS